MKKITIGDFADMTGTTVKTVLYYQRIGLLSEPERTPAGYRLYGAQELARMRTILHLKNQGFDLKRIAIVLGRESDDRSLREMLATLRMELTGQREAIDARIARIDGLLAEESVSLEGGKDTASFETISNVLGTESIREYAATAPDLLEQQKQVMGVMDDYDWGANHHDDLMSIAAYFKDHPNDYRTALDLGKRLSALADVDVNDSAIDALAHEAAAFCAGKPELQNLLSRPSGITGARAQVFDEMMDDLIPPAQRRYGRLFKDYLKGKHDEG